MEIHSTKYTYKFSLSQQHGQQQSNHGKQQQYQHPLQHGQHPKQHLVEMRKKSKSRREKPKAKGIAQISYKIVQEGALRFTNVWPLHLVSVPLMDLSRVEYTCHPINLQGHKFCNFSIN